MRSIHAGSHTLASGRWYVVGKAVFQFSRSVVVCMRTISSITMRFSGCRFFRFLTQLCCEPSVSPSVSMRLLKTKKNSENYDGRKKNDDIFVLNLHLRSSVTPSTTMHFTCYFYLPYNMYGCAAFQFYRRRNNRRQRENTKTIMRGYRSFSNFS